MFVKIIHDHDTQRSRGFGFVTFANADEARRAVQQMDGRVVDGRNLRCNLAPDKERDRRDTSFVPSFSGRGRHAVDDEADTRKHGSGRVGWDRDEHDRRQRCASKNDGPENDENRKRRKKHKAGVWFPTPSLATRPARPAWPADMGRMRICTGRKTQEEEKIATVSTTRMLF